MVLFNVTVIIDDSINDEWLAWMNDLFVPAAMATGYVVSERLLRVLDSPNEGITYCLQFVIDDIGSYKTFQEGKFTQLMLDHGAKFQNKFVSFSTLMEFIDR